MRFINIVFIFFIMVSCSKTRTENIDEIEKYIQEISRSQTEKQLKKFQNFEPEVLNKVSLGEISLAQKIFLKSLELDFMELAKIVVQEPSIILGEEMAIENNSMSVIEYVFYSKNKFAPVLLGSNKKVKKYHMSLLIKKSLLSNDNKFLDYILKFSEDSVLSYLFLDGGANTLIHLAAKNCNKELVALFLKQGVNPDLQDAEGETLLFKAFRSGCVELLDLAYPMGANVNHFNKKGENLLLLALSLKNEKLVDKLFKMGFIFPEEINCSEEVCFHENYLTYSAFEADSPNLVLKLLSKGLDPSEMDPQGRTILHYGAKKGDLFFLEKILNNTGVDLFQKDHKGRTAYDLALESGKIDAANLIKKRVQESKYINGY